ncbi:hypothetical protein C8J56DRAFT_959820 [Mycena floridula]|nr:hypothetical protein C8J56DRAFT_959820 [Mycena floridula]
MASLSLPTYVSLSPAVPLQYTPRRSAGLVRRVSRKESIGRPRRTGSIRKYIRPLPPIPSGSQTPNATSPLSLTIRPLPSLPPRRPPPQSPLPPIPESPPVPVKPWIMRSAAPPPVPEKPAGLRPPLPPKPARRQPSVLLRPIAPASTRRPVMALTLQTSASALQEHSYQAPRFDPGASPEPSPLELSPLSPSIPVMPTPHTAHRRRMSKLRRHLGEQIDERELLSAIDERLDHPDLLRRKVVKGIQKSGDAGLYRSAAITARKVLYMVDDDDGDSEDEYDEELADYSWITTGGMTFRAVPVRKYSKKWVREKGSKRWEDLDYAAVNQTLRNLRAS